MQNGSLAGYANVPSEPLMLTGGEMPKPLASMLRRPCNFRFLSPSNAGSMGTNKVFEGKNDTSAVPNIKVLSE